MQRQNHLQTLLKCEADLQRDSRCSFHGKYLGRGVVEKEQSGEGDGTCLRRMSGERERDEALLPHVGTNGKSGLAKESELQRCVCARLRRLLDYQWSLSGQMEM